MVNRQKGEAAMMAKRLGSWGLGCLVVGGLTTGMRAAVFQNLDFESAVITQPISSMGFMASPAQVLPAWTITYSNPSTTTPSSMDVGQYVLDYTEVALMGPGTRTTQYSYDITQIQNNFMVHLGAINNPNGGKPQTVALSQTGMIPAGTKSIEYFLGAPSYIENSPGNDIYPAFDAIQLFINGTKIPSVVLSSGNSIWNMGADVSAFAGQNVELRFASSAVNTGYWGEYNAYLDAISFSTRAVPEPSSVGLLLLGVTGWGLRRQSQRA